MTWGYLFVMKKKMFLFYISRKILVMRKNKGEISHISLISYSFEHWTALGGRERETEREKGGEREMYR